MVDTYPETSLISAKLCLFSDPSVFNFHIELHSYPLRFDVAKNLFLHVLNVEGSDKLLAVVSQRRIGNYRHCSFLLVSLRSTVN